VAIYISFLYTLMSLRVTQASLCGGSRCRKRGCIILEFAAKLPNLKAQRVCAERLLETHSPGMPVWRRGKKPIGIQVERYRTPSRRCLPPPPHVEHRLPNICDTVFQILGRRCAQAARAGCWHAESALHRIDGAGRFALAEGTSGLPDGA
jgi:hypothetical protein